MVHAFEHMLDGFGRSRIEKHGIQLTPTMYDLLIPSPTGQSWINLNFPPKKMKICCRWVSWSEHCWKGLKNTVWPIEGWSPPVLSRLQKNVTIWTSKLIFRTFVSIGTSMQWAKVECLENSMPIMAFANLKLTSATEINLLFRNSTDCPYS